MQPEVTADRWLGLAEQPIDVGPLASWVVRPDCGAFVVFAGTVRDHAEGRDDVERLTYECYPSAAEARLASVADEVKARWPMVGRVAMVHRVGTLELSEVAVVVAVSAPHRAEAFEAARFAIDAIKASVPIWKREEWAGGQAWGTDAQPLVSPADVGVDGADPSSSAAGQVRS